MPAVQGGETVRLVVRAHAMSGLQRPIVGFIIKDRLGQHLFGENTFQRYQFEPQALNAGQGFYAEFVFRIPLLPRGPYSVAVAVADGTQADHVVHEWRHDALLFESHWASVTTGLVGIPMRSVTLGKVDF